VKIVAPGEAEAAAKAGKAAGKSGAAKK